MPRYRVTHPYGSGGTALGDAAPFGPWSEGDVVELDEADAAWIEGDSPGTLKPEQSAKPKAKPAGAGEQTSAHTGNTPGLTKG